MRKSRVQRLPERLLLQTLREHLELAMNQRGELIKSCLRKGGTSAFLIRCGWKLTGAECKKKKEEKRGSSLEERVRAMDGVKGGWLEADVEKCITRQACSVASGACGHNISRGNGESAWAGC